MPTDQSVTFPPDALRSLLRTDVMRAMLDPSAEVPGAQDPAMLRAEFWNTIDLVGDAVASGDTWGSVLDVRAALFDFADGGGFGIRHDLIDATLGLLVPAASEQTDDEAPTFAADGVTSPLPVPHEAAEKLGYYVYALVDPRDGQVFYIGKGRGSRVYHHVWSVLGDQKRIESTDRGSDTRDGAATTSAKNSRIQAILAAGHLPQHWVVRHDITGDADAQDEAYAIEQALIDGVALTLDTGQGHKLTNIAGGHTRTEHGRHRIEELVLRYAAKPAPPIERPFAVVVAHGAAVADATEEERYQAARHAWSAGAARKVPDLPVFVVSHDVVRAVYRVTSWDKVLDEGSPGHPVYEFNGERDAGLEEIYLGTSLSALKQERSNGQWRQHGWHPYL